MTRNLIEAGEVDGVSLNQGKDFSLNRDKIKGNRSFYDTPQESL